MKLLFCPLCEDIVKLALAHEDYRTCTCGKSCGKYMTHEHAIYDRAFCQEFRKYVFYVKCSSICRIINLGLPV